GMSGRLAVVKDATTQTFLQHTLLNHFHHRGPVWIGLTNTANNSSYTWDSAMTSVCRQCGDVSSNTPCTDLETVFAPFTICPEDKPYCMNDIYHRGGLTDIFQRCVSRGTCDQEWYSQSSNKPQCSQYDHNVYSEGLECHLCCYGDSCNDDLLPNNSTLYQRNSVQPLTTTTYYNHDNNAKTYYNHDNNAKTYYNHDNNAQTYYNNDNNANTCDNYDYASANNDHARAPIKPSLCFTCGDLDNDMPCTQPEMAPQNPFQCPAEMPFCMNDIYQEAGKAPAVYKRCVDEQGCQTEWYQESSDKAACFQYDPSVYTEDLVCHLCCHGDGCNAQLLPEKSTLYKP
ncbi:hypothetical protein BaRGS_00027922, partial [Batillaria attramentaria]